MSLDLSTTSPLLDALLRVLPGAAPAALLVLLGVAVLRLACARRALATERRLREHERAAHADELAALSAATLHDGLTGLPNRVLLLDRLRHACARRDASFGVLFLDLDGFKAVNDTYGHAAGDEVLRVVAQRLSATVRAADTAARLAGDEFVVLCDDVDGAEGLRVAARRVEAALSAPVRLGDRTVCLGSSVGAVMHLREPGHPAPDAAAARVLARADAAMYEVKRARQLRLVELGALNRAAVAAAPALVLP